MVVATWVCLAAVLAIILAAQRRLIGSPSFWILAFAGKFALSLALTQFAWFEPLAPDLLRVPKAIPGVQDANLYDYYALQALHDGILNSWDTLNFTWLSFGVTGYLALVYRVFGVSVAYVSMCNALLSFGGLMMLSATLRKLFGPERIWDLIVLATFIPSIAYYDSTPAKEPLTHCLFYTSLFILTGLIWRREIRLGRLIQAVVALGLLSVVRANVVLLLVASNAWPVLRRIGFWRALSIGILCAALAIGTLIGVTGSTKSLVDLFDLNGRFEQTAGFIEERSAEGESGLKQAVAEKFAPTNIGNLLLWSPLRAMIWFYLPYPLLVPSLDGISSPPTLRYEARLEKVRAVHDQAFVLTGWLLILATPFLIGAAWSLLKNRNVGLRMLLFNIAGSAMLIGNLMFVMGRRYRTLIEPLVLAVVLVAMQYRLGRKLIWPVWVTMVVGVVLVAVLRV
jgi:hypothetical protein